MLENGILQLAVIIVIK